MKKSILAVAYIILTLFGLVLMKLGGNTGTFSIKSSSFEFTMSFISLLGFLCYIASFLLFTNIVIKFNLNYIIPVTAGIIQVLTLICGYTIFKEPVSINGVIGVALVIMGIMVMNIKRRNI